MAPSVLRRPGAAALVLGLALALQPPGEVRSADGASGPPPPPRQVTAESLAAALPRLEALATEMLGRTGVPGLAIVVVHADRVVFLKGYGLRRVGEPGAVDADTVFQLASLSKPIAATVVAGLVGDGRVGWDDPVLRTLPQARIGSPAIAPLVTIRDLLSHRSGLPDHAGDHLEDLGFDRATILERLRLLPTGNRFRADYAYTNFGFTAGAVAAANAVGRPWEQLSLDRLYGPLGMTHTSSRHADFAGAANRASLHVPEAGRWVARYQRDADAQAPAGGVSSSVRDLGQWLRLQLAGGRLDGRAVVDAAALAETHRPQIVSQPPRDPAIDRAGFYGLGWNVSTTDRGTVQLGHSGAFDLGAATAVYLLPAESLGIIVLSNSQPLGVPEALSLSFLDLATTGAVQRDYLATLRPLFRGMEQQDYPAVVTPARPLPARPAAAYTGSYANPYVGQAAVVRRGDGLELQLGPRLTSFPLTPVSGDTFRYQPAGENAYGPSAVSFTVGSDGRATAVRIDNLNLNGQGVLQRR
ncbi:serine hydrolase [Cyanobium gracile UHCC 0139]|uniref:Serine hydrolase n=1 Tax=Cyanobium gracile UHCC 0139 TaxID=3110308 RepID=A0ABU5RQF7_9CYAN|nr:serine hydrolase [Cyanobium gracile]MEA5389991.1 serine hydrolase [Cyanobium gracile UHCC 0139]